MRPLRLEVEGFTSFRDRAVVEFEGLDLFAITGPTGAGKSSLIDAIVFALYGQVPRVGDDYKQLISHGKERLNVLFEFAVGDERYRIARAVRRTGTAQQRLERLDGTDPEPLADRVREIRAKVEEILGLDYDGFTRSVVLPQGQFDAFLTGEPKERRKILVALLRLGVYDDMLKIANQRASTARQESAFIGQSLEQDFADATAEAREALVADLAAGGADAKRVEAALVALETGLGLARQVRAARQESAALEGEREREEARRREAEGLLAGADVEREALRTLGEDMEARIVALGFDETRHVTLMSVRPRGEQLVQLRRGLERLEHQHREMGAALAASGEAQARAEEAAATATAVRTEAEAEATRARERSDAAHREHAALALRRTLHPGEPCPVCAQTVRRVPKGGEPALDEVEADLRGAETASRAAARGEQESRVALEQARAEVATRTAELAQLAERRDEARAQAADCVQALAAAGFEAEAERDADALAARLTGELKTLEAGKRQRSELEARRAEAEKKSASLEARIAAAAAERDGAAERLERLAGRHGEAARALETARAALEELAAGEGWTGIEAAAARDEVDVIEACRAARQGAARDLAAHVATLRQRIATVEEKIARATELRTRRAELERSAALVKTLSDHLRANELVAWIQEEALRRLAEDGTRHLERLSQGRYALRLGAADATEAGAKAEQDFFVVDRWSADSVRSVRTLSGGETFLASLALALALAESLASLSAEGGARDALESLFLDEGFGSLDAETLDVVVEALDALHGGQRMVGIVTHVRELAERMPARLEIRKVGPAANAVVA